MATADMGFTGSIGGLIYYRVGNKIYVRTKPTRVRQTKATKARAGEFGKASSLGAVIRSVLDRVISNSSDNKMQTRLVSMLFSWFNSGKNNDAHLKDLSPFEFFSFEESVRKTVLERWKISLQIRPSAPGMVELKIPAFRPTESMSAPSNTIQVLCRIACGACDLFSCIGTGTFYTEMIFQYNDSLVEEQTISMNLPTTPGTLIVTGISLEYSLMKNGERQNNNNKAFKPAGIVHALYI